MKPLHPLCLLFPPASEEDYQTLKKSIQEFGFDRGNPITTYQGHILDGGNRARACDELGVPPVYDPFCGKDLIGFVFSKNFARRHLNAAQRAMIAAQFSKLTDGDHKILGISATNQRLASKFNVSRQSLHVARGILGISEELGNEVKNGTVSLKAAEGLSKLPEEELKAALSGDRAKLKVIVKEKRKKKSEVVFTPDPNYVAPTEPTEREKLIASESAPKVEQAPTASLPDRTPVAGSQTPKKAIKVEDLGRVMHDPFAPADRLPGFATWFRSWWAAKTNPYGKETAPARGAKEVYEVVDARLKEVGL